MKEIVATTAIAAGTGFFGWLFGKMKTPREKKKSDIELINSAIAPLLVSITQLTEQNSEMVTKLLQEQDKNLALLKEKMAWSTERCELMDKISGLEKKVQTLENTVKKYIKKNEQ